LVSPSAICRSQTAHHCESLTPQNKKADVAEHQKAFDRIGLLFNEPPDTAGLFFI
jgi:hypothetical protein